MSAVRSRPLTVPAAFVLADDGGTATTTAFDTSTYNSLHVYAHFPALGVGEAASPVLYVESHHAPPSDPSTPWTISRQLDVQGVSTAVTHSFHVKVEARWCRVRMVNTGSDACTCILDLTLTNGSEDHATAALTVGGEEVSSADPLPVALPTAAADNNVRIHAMSGTSAIPIACTSGGAVSVAAVDLDIRAIDYSSDSVKIYGLDGSNEARVLRTNNTGELATRPLVHSTDSIGIYGRDGDGDEQQLKTTNTGELVIRSLGSATDEVAVVGIDSTATKRVLACTATAELRTLAAGTDDGTTVRPLATDSTGILNVRMVSAESSILVKSVYDAANAVQYISSTAGVKLRGLTWGHSTSSRASLHVYDATTGITGASTPLFSILLPQQEETALKLPAGSYLEFTNGIAIRAVETSSPSNTNSASNNIATFFYTM
jgi:hypothetical protein